MGLEFDIREDFELALSLTPDIGGATIGRILAKNALLGTTKERFFELSKEGLMEEYALTVRGAAFLTRRDKLQEKVAAYKARVQDKPVRLITLQDTTYPRRIEEFCKSAPGYLFAYGNLRAIWCSTFCVLASRDADAASLDLLERTVEEGVLDSKVLVTGASTPAYKRAAVVPLRWGAPRILVLDRGIFQALGDGLDQEPFPAARLWRYRFDPQTDLVVSRFRPDDPYIGVNNQMRDELVVALSEEVRVVHKKAGGNVDKLAARAESLGRKVWQAGKSL